MFKIKGTLIDLILSCIIFLLTIALIILIISLTIKKPKELPENKVEIKTIIGLESFDFIDNITIPEYPHENLGLTSKLILDCYTGTCIEEIFHKETYTSCPDHRNICTEYDRSWTEYRPLLIVFVLSNAMNINQKNVIALMIFRKKENASIKWMIII